MDDIQMESAAQQLADMLCGLFPSRPNMAKAGWDVDSLALGFLLGKMYGQPDTAIFGRARKLTRTVRTKLEEYDER